MRFLIRSGPMDAPSPSQQIRVFFLASVQSYGERVGVRGREPVPKILSESPKPSPAPRGRPSQREGFITLPLGGSDAVAAGEGDFG
jgi:hypothetical protein